MARFRKERYIQQIQSKLTGKWSFRVRLNGMEKLFSETDYETSSNAFNQAKKYRDRILADGSVFIPQDKTVRDVFEEQYDLFPVRVETKRKLDIFFNKYIKQKDKLISQVRANDILMDLNSMIEIATDDTIQRVLSIWKKIIHTALYREYITKDITLLIKQPTSHKNHSFKVNKVTDRQTIIEIENLCREAIIEPHDKLMIPLLLEFLYLSGCRICEALALTKDDITKDSISINKELGSSLTEKMVIRQCKTELSNRVIPLTDSLKDVLNQAKKISKSNYIFTDKDGNFYNSTNLGNRIHKIGKKNNLDFNMYSIRHLFATDIVRNKDIDQRTRMELMGHSNIGTTLDYARSSDELKIKALENRK